MCYTVAEEMIGLVIRHEDLIGTFEQKKALVAQFNLIDDTFFSVVMEHNAYDVEVQVGDRKITNEEFAAIELQ